MKEHAEHAGRNTPKLRVWSRQALSCWGPATPSLDVLCLSVFMCLCVRVGCDCMGMWSPVLPLLSLGVLWNTGRVTPRDARGGLLSRDHTSRMPAPSSPPQRLGMWKRTVLALDGQVSSSPALTSLLGLLAWALPLREFLLGPNLLKHRAEGSQSPTGSVGSHLD